MSGWSGALKPKTPCYVELESVNDLARLVCALERTPLPVFAFKLHGEDVIATPVDLLMGRQVIYYAKYSAGGEFLAYRNVGGAEYVSVVDAVTQPTFSYSPIIRVDKLPEELVKNAKKKVSKGSTYSSIKLKDVSSLAKVSIYRLILDEATLPLFLLKGAKTLLGTFMNMNDADSVSYFYHVELEHAPSGTFLKYSSQRGAKPSFTNSIDEHGYAYMKIIRLRKQHPLVMLND